MRTRLVTSLAAVALACGLAGPAAAHAAPTSGTDLAPTAHPASPMSADRLCPPAAWALGYTDSLDKSEAFGHEVGGLSALARDRRHHGYAAIEDHSGDQDTRMWFLHGLTGPGAAHVTGTLVLRQQDGTPYNGTDFDAEGMAIPPGGGYLVSSEVEPSIHLFNRRGIEQDTLSVPQRFRVMPQGEATDNATLEGLTISRDGRHVYAAMEGVLSGDISSWGDDTARRILVYTRRGHHYRLERQIGYRVDPGMRIAEAQAYGRDSLLVLEAAWNPTAGNTIRLYAVTGLRHAADVSDVANLGDSPSRLVRKRLVADVTACPTLGATSKEAQTNPLMDNYEAMTITGLRQGGHARRGRGHLAEVVLLSDDNFNATQTTRVLRLAARLP